MAGDTKLFQEALKRGSAHAWNEQWGKAADEYRRALREFPKDTSARTYLAMALYKSGAYRDALELYQGLLDDQPTSLTVLQRVAELQEMVGDPHSAAFSYGRLAEAHTRRGALKEAFRAWQKLVKLTPGNPILWNSLVRVATQIGAEKEIVPGYLGLARDLALQSRFQEAIQVAERAQTLDPESPLVVPMLAAIRKGIEYSFRAASFGEEVYPEDLMRYIPSVEVLQSRVQPADAVSPEPVSPGPDLPPPPDLDAEGGLAFLRLEPEAVVPEPEAVVPEPVLPEPEPPAPAAVEQPVPGVAAAETPAQVDASPASADATPEPWLELPEPVETPAEEPSAILDETLEVEPAPEPEPELAIPEPVIPEPEPVMPELAVEIELAAEPEAPVAEADLSAEPETPAAEPEPEPQAEPAVEEPLASAWPAGEPVAEAESPPSGDAAAVEDAPSHLDVVTALEIASHEEDVLADEPVLPAAAPEAGEAVEEGAVGVPVVPEEEEAVESPAIAEEAAEEEEEAVGEGATEVQAVTVEEAAKVPAAAEEAAVEASPAVDQEEAAEASPIEEPAVSREDRLDALLRLAESAWESGRLEDAATTYEEIVSAGLAKGRHLVDLGELYEEMGRKPQALTAFAKALEVEPDLPRAYLGLARVDLTAHRLDSAEANAQKAFSASRPEYPELEARAVELLLDVSSERAAYGDRGAAATGLAWLRSVVDVSRLPRVVAGRLASAPRDLLGVTVAEHFDEIAVLPVNQQGEVVSSLWGAEQMLGEAKLRTAADDVFRIVASYPDFLPAQSLLGRILLAQGRREQAAHRSERLVTLYELRGRPEGAREVLGWMAESGLTSGLDTHGAARLAGLLRDREKAAEAGNVETLAGVRPAFEEPVSLAKAGQLAHGGDVAAEGQPTAQTAAGVSGTESRGDTDAPGATEKALDGRPPLGEVEAGPAPKQIDVPEREAGGLRGVFRSFRGMGRRDRG